ncbi:hypothetical protein [Streptomyces sp. MMG1121]|uniref:hypothetical protein n=1 Tax=Streptomyces sp. MMG1121 TaxID=1415544 RepID=UPI0007C6AB77
MTGLGANGSLIAAALAVLDAGDDCGDVGPAAAARTLPLVRLLLIGDALADRRWAAPGRRSSARPWRAC